MKTKKTSFTKKLELDKIKIAALSKDQKHQILGGAALTVLCNYSEKCGALDSLNVC